MTVDGHSNGDTIALAAGASGLQSITVRYTASDGSKNLSGIRYNLWNPPAGNLLPFAGLFSNGGGFNEAGGYGEVDQTVTLTPGDWYFWTDAQNANGDYTSTGAWTSGYVLHVVQGKGSVTTTSPATSTLPADVAPYAKIAVDGHSNGDTIAIAQGGGVTATIRFAATDSSNNLSGIRYNLWNPPAGNLAAFTEFLERQWICPAGRRRGGSQPGDEPDGRGLVLLDGRAERQRRLHDDGRLGGGLCPARRRPLSGLPWPPRGGPARFRQRVVRRCSNFLNARWRTLGKQAGARPARSKFSDVSQ